VPDSIVLNFVALIESVALIAVALYIERACKIKDDGDSKQTKAENKPGSIESNPA
jgi:hypothetical protein